MRHRLILFAFASFVILLLTAFDRAADTAWIRINLLGYPPGGIKVAVWCSNASPSTPAAPVAGWQLVDALTGKTVYAARSSKVFGAYGPFRQCVRLNFTPFSQPGRYYLQAGSTRSPEFVIGDHVYEGKADFCLKYLRQQRSGFNPYLHDSCHTRDGYALYGDKAGLKDSTFVDVVGGWHDATDYLQYASTSANATYHLLMAYRDFPQVFSDQKKANGLDGPNGLPDVADEAKWGLNWLLKMHPNEDWMFNQIADDRDHAGMRLPKEDSFYGRGSQRPVYFLSGEPQQRGKGMNNTSGTSSTAGKFSSAFGLGADIFRDIDPVYSKRLAAKSLSAFHYAEKKPGATQTASVVSPYIYAEENWVDDMELAAAVLARNNSHLQQKGKNPEYLLEAMKFAELEPVTPWFGKDSARHYQWYPFINIGHYELARQLKGKERETVTGYLRKGIQLVWNKAKQNGFFRGVPFIWCSNNLTSSFAIQCNLYRRLSGDDSFSELEQANVDWLFGCNPWGVSMVYGLPVHGNTPKDPHSSFTHLKNYPIDGALMDGPVYRATFNSQLGITLSKPDSYAPFQSDLAVYHDDFADYSTNEPTMDGTASLIYLLAAKEAETARRKK
jgi:endoglucanase